MERLLRNALFLKRSIRSLEVKRRCLLGSSIQLSSFSSKARKASKADRRDSDEQNLSKKDLALKQVLEQINSSHGKGTIVSLGQSLNHPLSPNQIPVVSTGSFALDIALGVGGLPKGRVVEIYGPEASGKTTLALHVIAEAQKQGGHCVFVDAEHALDPALAKAIGVDAQKLHLAQPDCGEQALGLVDAIIKSGSVDVIVVDSVAALVPKSELEGEMGDAHMAMQARLMSQALRKYSHSLMESQAILIFINQVRSKLATFGGFGAPNDVTCGGNALKFYASVRLNVKRIGLVKKGEETVGSQVLVKVMKNKLAPPFRTAQFELVFGKGICRESELIELGLKHKFITKAGGAYYSLGDKKLCGKDGIKRYLVSDPTVREELETKLRDKLVTSTEEESSEEATKADSSDEELIAADA